jgi:hypothetical protein
MQFGARLAYVTFHTENSELFVARHPGEREKFCAFLARSAAYGRTLAPRLKFTTYNTPRHDDALVRCMTRGMDLIGAAAIAEFPGADEKSFERAVARMIQLSAGRKLAIVEMGWPSATKLGSSPDIQKKRIQSMLATLGRHAAQIEFASIYTVFDEDRAIARRWIAAAFPTPPWTAAQRAALLEWFTSLGLKTIDMRPKPAWDALVAQ